MLNLLVVFYFVLNPVLELIIDGPFPKLCPAVALSHQDGRHSAVSLLLKAAVIQVSDYRLLGAPGCNSTCVVVSVILLVVFYFVLNPVLELIIMYITNHSSLFPMTN
jgi:multisubunit Na+/H+ antiporter MnhG subunit